MDAATTTSTSSVSFLSTMPRLTRPETMAATLSHAGMEQFHAGRTHDAVGTFLGALEALKAPLVSLTNNQNDNGTLIELGTGQHQDPYHHYYCTLQEPSSFPPSIIAEAKVVLVDQEEASKQQGTSGRCSPTANNRNHKASYWEPLPLPTHLLTTTTTTTVTSSSNSNDDYLLTADEMERRATFLSAVLVFNLAVATQVRSNQNNDTTVCIKLYEYAYLLILQSEDIDVTFHRGTVAFRQRLLLTMLHNMGHLHKSQGRFDTHGRLYYDCLYHQLLSVNNHNDNNNHHLNESTTIGPQDFPIDFDLAGLVTACVYELGMLSKVVTAPCA